MDRRLRIFLADLVHDYRPNYYCTPLGVGFVGAHVAAKFGSQVDIRLFKSPGKLIEAMRGDEKPDVIGLSNYSWNCEINKLIVRRAAAELPNTILLQGGPHIRVDERGIADHLRASPDVDYYAMLEGEYPTAGLIGHMLSKARPVAASECDVRIPGLAFLSKDELIYTPRETKKGDLADIPSPYLTGMLDEFIQSAVYLPLFETNRGCPFACTFCVWGISALNKVRKFDLDRICAEFDYVAGRSQATHWYFTDANFGMFERDVEIAKALRRVADKSPYIQRISIQWAKNSSRYCVEIQRILKGLCDPLAAVQTTDPHVLKHIKRDNIKMETMTDLVEQARRDDILMTTDVLCGLPEETLESHFSTLRNVFALGFNSFNVGQIRLLPGSEMESEQDRKRYGLKTRYRLISGFSGLYDGEPVTEYEESIVETNALSREEMFTIRVVHFLTWAMWNSGLAQPLMRYMFKAEGINPLDSILDLVRNDPPGSLRSFMEDYKTEARAEWFDTAEDLEAHFRKNASAILNNEYLKLNLKYLAKILLDRSIGRALLESIARRCKSPVRDELVQFSLERIFFVRERTPAKSLPFSRALVEALARVYPTISPDAAPECRFSLTPKQFRALESEINRFDFAENPVRAVTLALSSYGDKFLFDFAFGQSVATAQEKFFDSFDYANQLGTYATRN